MSKKEQPPKPKNMKKEENQGKKPPISPEMVEQLKALGMNVGPEAGKSELKDKKLPIKNPESKKEVEKVSPEIAEQLKIFGITVPAAEKKPAPKPKPKAERPKEKPEPKLKAERPAAPKKIIEAKKEKLEISLEKTRTAYARAKLNLEKEPQNPELAAEFESAQKTYLGERRKDLQSKLEVLKKEELKGKDAKTAEKELRKAASMHLLAEFKQSYDAKTKILAEEKVKNKPWLLKKLQSVGEWYNQRSLKEKLLISGVLMGGAAASLAIGGGAGATLGALIGAGRLGQRALSGLSLSVGLEGFLKKSEEKTLSAEANSAYENLIKESFDKNKFATPQRLVKFLQAKDLALEKEAGLISGKLADREKSLDIWRIFISGSVGALVTSGVTVAAFEKLAEVTGLGDSVHHLLEKAGLAGPEVAHGAAPEAIAQATEKHAVETVQEGGSISKAAWQFVHEGKLSKEEMLSAWNNSSVEINGIQVPIKDVALSHAGDQVVYEPGAGGAPGHFQVMDFAKDKLSLGTNQDLYQVYEKLGKEPPNWLDEAAGQNAFEALKDNNLDANEARNISFWFERGSLNDHEAILEKLNNKVISLGETAGKDFIDLRDRLGESPEYTKAWQAFEGMLKNTGLNDEQYQAIKNLKVGEFLEKRGRSWWADYFFSPSSSVPTAGTVEGVTPVSEILHQRKLAGFLRKSLLSSWEKDLTVERFLKLLAHG